MNKIFCENGVFFVNDLISENKMIFTYESHFIVGIEKRFCVLKMYQE
jgi:hypothetical protein